MWLLAKHLKELSRELVSRITEYGTTPLSFPENFFGQLLAFENEIPANLIFINPSYFNSASLIFLYDPHIQQLSSNAPPIPS